MAENPLWIGNADTGDGSGSSFGNRMGIAGMMAEIESYEVGVSGEIAAGVQEVFIAEDCTIAAELLTLVSGNIEGGIELAGVDSSGNKGVERQISGGGTLTDSICNVEHDFWTLRDLHLTGTDENAGNFGFETIAGGVHYVLLNCRFSACYDGVNDGDGTSSKIEACRAHDNANDGFAARLAVPLVRCVAHDNAHDGFIDSRACVDCLSFDNGRHGFYNTLLNKNCTADGNNNNGFFWSVETGFLEDCLSTFNGVAGARVSLGSLVCRRLATFGNVGGVTVDVAADGQLIDEDPILLPGDPYVDRDNNNYELTRTTPGDGARNVSFTSEHGGHVTTQSIGALTAPVASTLSDAGGIIGDAALIKKLEFTFTSTTQASGLTLELGNGSATLVRVATIPATGADAPTGTWHVYLKDADGVDVLDGDGAGRSATVAQQVVLDPPRHVSGALELGVTAAGKVVLYYQ